MRAVLGTRALRRDLHGVGSQLQDGGAGLLTFGKTLRTTNVIERLNEEFRRRVKTQGSLPSEDAALLPKLASWPRI